MLTPAQVFLFFKKEVMKLKKDMRDVKQTHAKDNIELTEKIRSLTESHENSNNKLWKAIFEL